MMYSDVPNFASVFGYTNASWTLKADLVCEYVCRLLNHMDRKGYRQCTPHNDDPTLTEEPWVNFSSGYIQRALAHQPKQGSKRPWRLYQNYALDLLTLRFGTVRDRAMSVLEPQVRRDHKRALPAASGDRCGRKRTLCSVIGTSALCRGRAFRHAFDHLFSAEQAATALSWKRAPARRSRPMREVWPDGVAMTPSQTFRDRL